MSLVTNASYASVVTNTQGNLPSNPPSNSRKAKNKGNPESSEGRTTVAVEQVLSTEQSKKKEKVLTTQNLKERVKDLSPKTCEDFEKHLKGDFDAISTFSSELEQKNGQYLRDKPYLPSSAEKVEKYKRRREKDDTTYTTYHQAFIEKIQPGILERRSECEKASADCEFKKELLIQLYKGSDNRFRRSYLGQDDLFGPDHRLDQASKSLKSRQSSLSVDEKTPVSDVSAPGFSEESFPVYLKAKAMSEKWVKFKEEVLAIQETLLVQKGKESSSRSSRFQKTQEEAANSYTTQAAQFEDLKKAYESSKREFTDRLKNLEESIKRERKLSTTKTLGTHLFEKAEIEERIRLIENRMKRIGELLEERKITFGLEESKEASANQKTNIKYDFTPFGGAVKQIAEYVSKVVIAKEEIVAQTQTELKLQDNAARFALFLSASKNLMSLQEEKAENIDKIFRDSIEALEKAIASYALHINALDQHLEGMQDHLDKAESSIEQRKEWEFPKKDEPLPSSPPTEKTSEAKKDEAKSSGGIFSWFSSSKKPTDKQPGEKPITNV
ncbi:hypothetical protein [Candidatus Protochlamydia phocaeensis]|uniref:hypothetical protein n=1 Tax=Candidatus Protochlamydia phocaeensis TaxID=1414722 RepID=UPI0008391DEE|nr:hypothetical protein [Candidatus Protochlamydia phocaeensis]